VASQVRTLLLEALDYAKKHGWNDLENPDTHVSPVKLIVKIRRNLYEAASSDAAQEANAADFRGEWDPNLG